MGSSLQSTCGKSGIKYKCSLKDSELLMTKCRQKNSRNKMYWNDTKKTQKIEGSIYQGSSDGLGHTTIFQCPQSSCCVSFACLLLAFFSCVDKHSPVIGEVTLSPQSLTQKNKVPSLGIPN